MPTIQGLPAEFAIRRNRQAGSHPHAGKMRVPFEPLRVIPMRPDWTRTQSIQRTRMNSPVTQPASNLLALRKAFLTACILCAGTTYNAFAQDSQQGLREEVGKPLIAAEEMAKAKNYEGALAKIKEAEAVANRTQFENYYIDRLRATTALSAGKDDIAVKSLIAAFDAPQMPAADKPKIGDAIARISYRLKDYKQAADWAERTLKEPGAPVDLRLIQGHSQFLLNDFAGTVKNIGAYLDGVEKSGKTPPEDQYRLLASAANRAKDDAAYVAVLEKLVVNYPKRDYWADLMFRSESKAPVPERLVLDSYRLKLAVGVLKEQGQFLDMAQYVMNIGYPAEAEKVLDAGVEIGVLGEEAKNERYKKLRATVNKELAEEKARAAKGAQIPNTSIAKLNNGFDLVIKGEGAKGLELMEQGLALPDLKRPEEARLRYGIAAALAGQNAKAAETFKSLAGTEVGELARLWGLYAARKK
ncbi:MAG TPA: hypothetical protein VFV17_11055 [Usitatibacteraceae bacterium]|nr:hypothetical protein [Usitatibacteraceae bacterium]